MGNTIKTVRDILSWNIHFVRVTELPGNAVHGVEALQDLVHHVLVTRKCNVNINKSLDVLLLYLVLRLCCLPGPVKEQGALSLHRIK